MARQSNVTSAGISQIEAGDRCPSLPVLFKIADAFNISVEELISDRHISNSQIIKDAVNFRRKFGKLERLSESDQKLILDLAKRLSDKG